MNHINLVFMISLHRENYLSLDFYFSELVKRKSSEEPKYGTPDILGNFNCHPRIFNITHLCSIDYLLLLRNKDLNWKTRRSGFLKYVFLWIRSHCHFMIFQAISSYDFISSLFLFFYTSTKSWRGYIFTSVCLSVCVCVCVCVCPFVNKMPIEPIHRFRRGFR